MANTLMTPRPVVSLIQNSLALLVCTLLFACSSSTHTPAPVVSLDMSEPEKVTPFTQDVYTIQPGDTLFAIAWYSGNDYRDLARINNLRPPYTIRVGSQIRLKALPAPPRRQADSPPTRARVARSSTTSDESGRTSSKTDQGVIDRPSDQAYGESEKNVNDQRVSAPKQANSRAASQRFEKTVSQWVWPASGDIVGRFSSAESGNKGIDIRNTRGTPIVAAADGKVVYTGEALRGYGRLVIIKHTETFLSAYAHNDRILVEEQQWVTAGEQIGTMGSSGTDTVMLHFEVRYRGRSLDPQRYLPRQ